MSIWAATTTTTLHTSLVANKSRLVCYGAKQATNQRFSQSVSQWVIRWMLRRGKQRWKEKTTKITLTHTHTPAQKQQRQRRRAKNWILKFYSVFFVISFIHLATLVYSWHRSIIDLSGVRVLDRLWFFMQKSVEWLSFCVFLRLSGW